MPTLLLALASNRLGRDGADADVLVAGNRHARLEVGLADLVVVGALGVALRSVAELGAAGVCVASLDRGSGGADQAREAGLNGEALIPIHAAAVHDTGNGAGEALCSDRVAAEAIAAVLCEGITRIFAQ